MPQVKVREGEELNGLGVILQQAIDKNLQDPKKAKKVENLKATIVMKETTSDVAVTVHFERGQISIHNGAIDKPSGTMIGTWENLGKILVGEIGPLWAAITFKVKTRGNPLTVLKASKIIILGKETST